MSDLGKLRNYMLKSCLIDKQSREAEERLEKEISKIKATIETGFHLFKKHYYIGDLKCLEFCFNSDGLIINDPNLQQRKEMKISDDKIPNYDLVEDVKGMIEGFKGYSVSVDDECKDAFIVTISFVDK